MAEKIGFIGLGVMGRPMSRNLMKAGYELVVHNRSQGPVRELSADGAEVAETPYEVAEKSNIIITMLPDSSHVSEVVTGEHGVFQGAKEESLLVDMSTISPIATRELAQEANDSGVEMLDAPVSGGDIGAQNGTLSIMVGGSAQNFQRAEPIFSAMGKTIVHVGAIGTGQVVKACNQLVAALAIEALSEALVLGSKAGVDPALIIRVLSGGLAANKIMEVRGKRLIEHDFEPGFKAELHSKDLDIALAAGKEYRVSLPSTALVAQMFQALQARGQGEKDFTAVLTVVEELAQHKVGESS